MNRIFIGIVLIVISIVSAFAIPTLADRQHLCESKPLSFVWVEKTNACIPINPCESQEDDIRDGYCIPSIATVESEKNAELVMQRYTEKVLNTHVINVIPITSKDDKYLIYLGVRTADDSYYVFRFYKPFGMPVADNLLIAACWAYGKSYVEQETKENEYWCTVHDENECTDIVDFASLLVGEMVSGEIVNLGTTLCKMNRTTNKKEKK